MGAHRSNVVAHRGAGHAVENTLEAFEAAIQFGADLVEFDVRRAGDGRLIVFHEPDVGGRLLADMSLDEIQCAAGFRPPTLAEVLEFSAGRIGLNVELKESGTAEDVLDALRARSSGDDVLVSSFVDEELATARALWPDMPTGLLLDGLEPGGPDVELTRAHACSASCVMLEHGFYGSAGVGWANAADLCVYLWTVNDRQSLRAHLADPRVCGVITDVVDVAVAIRAECAPT